jgi:hypothetical protein
MILTLKHDCLRQKELEGVCEHISPPTYKLFLHWMQKVWSNYHLTMVHQVAILVDAFPLFTPNEY